MYVTVYLLKTEMRVYLDWQEVLNAANLINLVYRPAVGLRDMLEIVITIILRIFSDIDISQSQ